MALTSRSCLLVAALVLGFAAVSNAQWGGIGVPRGGLKLQPARIPARVAKGNDTLVKILGPGGITVIGGTPPYNLTYLQTAGKRAFNAYLSHQARSHAAAAAAGADAAAAAEAAAFAKQFGGAMRYPFFATATPEGNALLTRDDSVKVPRWYAFIPFPVAFTVTDSAGKVGAGTIMVNCASD